MSHYSWQVAWLVVMNSQARVAAAGGDSNEISIRGYEEIVAIHEVATRFYREQLSDVVPLADLVIDVQATCWQPGLGSAEVRSGRCVPSPRSSPGWHRETCHARSPA